MQHLFWLTNYSILNYVSSQTCQYIKKTEIGLWLNQDALRGGKEELFDYRVDYLHAGDMEALANDAIGKNGEFTPSIADVTRCFFLFYPLYFKCKYGEHAPGVLG